MAERKGRGRGEERVWGPILDKLTGLMEGSKTALIFANNRRLCERLTLRLNDHYGGEIARSHHGSVSREQRLLVERMLKDGELRCLVATSSLELGIDVGHIDLVIQIDSPKSAAAAIQRFGRAGHAVGGVSRGVLLARSRSELAEAAVLARAAAARDIEAIRVPRHSLDVLSQQLVAMAATDDWEMGRLAAVLGRSDGYRGLPQASLLATLKVLSGLFPFARPLVEWSGEDGRLSAAAGTAMAAIMGAGTIPQSTGYPVHHAGTRMHIGELDEEYIYESRVGDVFQLGAGAWTIQAIRPDRIYVTEAGSRMGEIPFWKAQPISRSYELGSRIADFLGDLSGRDLMQSDVARQAEQWLTETCNMDEPAACALISYVKGQMAVCAVPTAHRLVIELYVDDLSRQHLVVHSLHGRRFNHTWQLALMLEFEQLTSARIYSGVRDNGFEFVFTEWDPSWLQAISRVDAERLESLLLHALPASPLFGIHFRRIAEISLLLTRGFSRMPGWKRRMRGEDLLREALPYAERFPYIREALQEAIRESLAVPEVKARLRAVASGEVEVNVVNTRFPSPFAAEFMMDFVAEAFYESDAIGRDLQAQVTGVSRTMAEELFGADAMRQAISPEVVRREQERLESAAAPAAATADVYRHLKERGDLTGAELVRLLGDAALVLVAELVEQGRVCPISLAGEERYICSDEQDFYAGLPAEPLSIDFVLKRYIGHRIAFTPEELAHRYALDPAQAQAIITRWAEARQLEPAPFAEPGKEELWTASQVAARIVRFSLQEFRQQAEPAPAARYASLLAERLGLRLAPQQTVRSLGDEGTELLRQALTRLEGLFLPLSQWESFLLPVRLPGYRPADLDLLCSMGEVRWIGRRPEGEKEGRVAFFLADSHDLYTPYLRSTVPTRHPELLGLLLLRGASFLSAIARERDQLPSETLSQLLELVWEGHVANDQFAPLRIKSPGAAAKGGRSKGFQSGLGRWYALTGDETVSRAPSQAPSTPSQASSFGAVPARNSGGAASPDATPAAPAPLSSAISQTEANRDAALAAAWVKQLLARFAIITRDIVAAYSPYPWDALYPVLKRLEDWGMLTRGYFIAGLPGMQYAEKAVVEQLRSPAIWMDGEDTILVNAADPANPYGLILDWPEHLQAGFARKPSHYLMLSKEGWELWLENGGRRIVEMGQTASGMAAGNHPAEELRLKRVLQSLLQGGRLKKIQVEEWNGIRTSESPIAPVLARLGAERDREAYVFWPSSFRTPR
jgi:ATP-dependent Lhr-like helicase